MDFSLTSNDSKETAVQVTESQKTEELPFLAVPTRPEKSRSVQSEDTSQKKTSLILVPILGSIVDPPTAEANNAAAPKQKLTKSGKIDRRYQKKNLTEPPEEAWHPSDGDYLMVKMLAELGWPNVNIAEALGISGKKFANALVRDERLKLEYDAGVASAKGWQLRQLAWRPLPDDLRKIRTYAAKGYGEVEIAAKLGISRAALARRLADTPPLAEAFEIGQGEYRISLLDLSTDLLEEGGNRLKNSSSMLIFKLKAHCGLTDKAQQEAPKIQVEGTINHNVKLNSPEPVPLAGIADFAAKEMERSKAVTAEAAAKMNMQIVDVTPVESPDHESAAP